MKSHSNTFFTKFKHSNSPLLLTNYLSFLILSQESFGFTQTIFYGIIILMKIKPLHNLNIEVTVSFDEVEDIPLTETEVLVEGVEYSIDVISEDRKTFKEIQFASGAVAYNLLKSNFEINREKE